MCHDCIQQIAQSQTGGCRDRYRITDTEVVELIDVIAKFRRIVYFIDRQNNRFSRFTQHIRHLGIRIGHALTHIYDKQDHIRRRDRDLRLLTHLGQDNILRIRLDTASIDQSKRMV